MFKQKIVAAVLVLVLAVGFPMTVFASGQSSTMEFTVNYPEPTCNENQGYFSVVYTGNFSGYRLWTYFWNIQDQTEFDSSVSMKITFNNQVFTFEPDIFGDHYAGVTLANYSYDERMSVCYTKSLYATSMGPVYSDNYAGSNIVGILYGGNVTLGTSLQGFTVPIVHFSGEPSAVELNSKLDEIIYRLGMIEENTAETVSQLESIYNQNIEIIDKLDKMDGLLRDIKSQLNTANDWLEEIYNTLDQAPSKEKDEATQQGQQSTSEVTSSVDDKGADFNSAINKLSGAFSTESTSCSWTFPALYLPEIPGVMSRVQLSPEMPIDFEYWVNKIPSDILDLVQSLLTIGLIIYCFKEFYDLISYVLTLKGGSASE